MINEERQKLEESINKLNVIANLSDAKFNNAYFCKANMQHWFPNVDKKIFQQCCGKDCFDYNCIQKPCGNQQHTGRVIKQKQSEITKQIRRDLLNQLTPYLDSEYKIIDSDELNIVLKKDDNILDISIAPQGFSKQFNYGTIKILGNNQAIINLTLENNLPIQLVFNEDKKIKILQTKNTYDDTDDTADFLSKLTLQQTEMYLKKIHELMAKLQMNDLTQDKIKNILQTARQFVDINNNQTTYNLCCIQNKWIGTPVNGNRKTFHCFCCDI